MANIYIVKGTNQNQQKEKVSGVKSGGKQAQDFNNPFPVENRHKISAVLSQNALNSPNNEL